MVAVEQFAESRSLWLKIAAWEKAVVVYEAARLARPRFVRNRRLRWLLGDEPRACRAAAWWQGHQFRGGPHARDGGAQHGGIRRRLRHRGRLDGLLLRRHPPPPREVWGEVNRHGLHGPEGHEVS